MVLPTSGIDPILSQGARKSRQERPEQPSKKSAPSMATKLSRRRASAKFRSGNTDELREKARERMARLRARVKDDGDLAEAAHERARDASRKYRQTHAEEVSEKKRLARKQAYDNKYGHGAWLERYMNGEIRRREARELEDLQRYEEEYRRREEERERRQAAESLRRLAESGRRT